MESRNVIKISRAESQIVDTNDNPIFTSIVQVSCCRKVNTTMYRGNQRSDNVLVIYKNGKLELRDNSGARRFLREQEMLTDNPCFGSCQTFEASGAAGIMKWKGSRRGWQLVPNNPALRTNLPLLSITPASRQAKITYQQAYQARHPGNFTPVLEATMNFSPAAVNETSHFALLVNGVATPLLEQALVVLLVVQKWEIRKTNAGTIGEIVGGLGALGLTGWMILQTN